MGGFTGTSNHHGRDSLAHLTNNAAAWWFQDGGLLKLAPAILVGWGGFVATGFDAALINGLLSNPQFKADLGHPNASRIGVISLALSLGGIPPLLFISPIADRWGRRLPIAIGSVIVIAGALVQTFCIGGWSMFAGRFVLGFGSNFQSVVCPTYATEVAHPRFRAQVASIFAGCFYIGSILAAWSAFGGLHVAGNWSWRLCTLLQVGPSFLMLVACPFIPESPRYLIATGKEDQALAMLAKYHANGDSEDELVQFEFQEIKEAIRAEQVATTGISYMSFFKTPGNKHRLLIVLCLAFFGQWVGNGIISYYLSGILVSVGMTSPVQQTAFNGGLQISNLLISTSSSLFVERINRRTLWLTGLSGMLVSFIIITACSAVYAAHKNVSAGQAVLAFLYIYYGFFCISFTALGHTYLLEILPYSLRTRGATIFQFAVTCAMCFNAYANPVALAAIAWKYYIVYIVMICVAMVTIYFVYPETRGKLLEEISEVFDGPSAILPVVAAADDASGSPSKEKEGGKGETEALEYHGYT